MKNKLKRNWPLLLAVAMILYGVAAYISMKPGDEMGVAFVNLYTLPPLWFMLAGVWYGYYGKIKVWLLLAPVFFYTIFVITEIGDIPVILVGLIPAAAGLLLGTIVKRTENNEHRIKDSESV